LVFLKPITKKERREGERERQRDRAGKGREGKGSTEDLECSPSSPLHALPPPPPVWEAVGSLRSPGWLWEEQEKLTPQNIFCQTVTFLHGHSLPQADHSSPCSRTTRPVPTLASNPLPAGAQSLTPSFVHLPRPNGQSSILGPPTPS
jgi:hypothetical protein